MRRGLALLATSLWLSTNLCFAFAPAPVPPSPEEELRKWQGEWVLISRTLAGKDVSKNTVVAKLVVVGNTYTYVGKKDIFAEEEWKSPPFSVSLNTKESPRQFEATYEATPGEWCMGRRGQQLKLGIYKLQGDRFTMSSVHSSQMRPKDFKGKSEGVMVDVFERKKTSPR